MYRLPLEKIKYTFIYNIELQELTLKISCTIKTITNFDIPTMHFIGRVTMLFANNSLMECQITKKFLHIFFYTLT